MTQINYPDITRTSPSGILRLEVRSPDNDPVAPRDDPENGARQFWGGFQRDFTYTVLRCDSSEVVWRRNAADGDGLLDRPCAAWVSDQGHVVVITRSPFTSDLCLLDTAGDTSFWCDVASDVLEDHSHELHWTSAGPHWNEGGIGLFFETPSSKYFCFRTVLGRQVVLNLEAAHLERQHEALLGRLKETQAEWALNTVRAASQDARLFQERADDEETWELITSVWPAIRWCGTDRLSAAIPFLETLESSPLWAGCGLGWPMPNVGKTLLVNLALVPVVQTSLRLLGREPAGHSAYWLCDRSGPSQKSRIHVPQCLPDRARRLDTLRKTMSPHEVVECVGMPDERWPMWDYDLLTSSEGPCTVRVTWDCHTEHIESIDRVPPAWHDRCLYVPW